VKRLGAGLVAVKCFGAEPAALKCLGAAGLAAAAMVDGVGDCATAVLAVDNPNIPFFSRRP